MKVKALGFTKQDDIEISNEEAIRQEIATMSKAELEAIAGLCIRFMDDLSGDERAALYDRQYYARQILGGDCWDIYFPASPPNAYPTSRVTREHLMRAHKPYQISYEGKGLLGRLHARFFNWLARNAD